MKKRCSILLTACLMIAALTGCSQTQTVEQTSAQTTEVQQTEETLQEKEAQTFSIGYPSYLQESQGEAWYWKKNQRILWCFPIQLCRFWSHAE